MTKTCYNCQGQTKIFLPDETVVTCPICKGSGLIHTFHQFDLFVKTPPGLLTQFDMQFDKVFGNAPSIVHSRKDKAQ